jgi:hypothetical protein
MKLQTLINVLMHLLADDRAPHVSTDGKGVLVIPSLPEWPSSELPQLRKRKILVYHEFSMMAETLKTVLLVFFFQVACSSNC